MSSACGRATWVPGELAKGLVAMLAILALAASGSPAATAATTGLAQVHQACAAPPPRYAACLALVRTPVRRSSAAAAQAVPYALNSGAALGGPAGGLTPAELAGVYEYEPEASGTGQTIGIVDAYDDPKIEDDLATFDSHYGLPACTSSNHCFEKVGQTGSSSSLPSADTTGWSEEISLDVEVAHAVCPKCKILLVEADEPSTTDLEDAEDEAATLGATELSNGYGLAELFLLAYPGERAAYEAAYRHPGIPVVAAAGDEGFDGWNTVNEGSYGPETPNLPASLPWVVSVGGTSLKLTAGGARASEIVWNDNGAGDDRGATAKRALGASGGGCSLLFGAPPWQQAVAGFVASGCEGGRLAADVSAVGDPLTGFDIYDSYECAACVFSRIEGGWATFGGTSLSTPIIAALYALAGGGGGLEAPALTLYGRNAHHFDVTSGGNGFCGGESVALCGQPDSVLESLVDCEGTTACNAGPGFDGPSGVGAPIGLDLFKPELPTAVITPPVSPVAESAAAFSASDSSDPYPGGSISSYSWNWGDGTEDGSGVSPSHTYAGPGRYDVTLTVTDNYGLTSISSPTPVNVTVHPPRCASPPTVEQQPANTTVIAPASASFTVKEGQVPANCSAAAIQWQISTDSGASWSSVSGANSSGANSDRLQIDPTATAESGEEFRAALTNADGPTDSGTATLRVEAERPDSLEPPSEGASTTTGGASGGIAAFKEVFAPPVPDATLASASLHVSESGAVSLEITCPDDESECEGTVTLTTLDAVFATTGSSARARAAILTLARGSFSVHGGRRKTVTLHLSAKGRALLARSRSLRVRATIVAHDPAGTSHTTRTIVTLHRPARGRR